MVNVLYRAEVEANRELLLWIMFKFLVFIC